MHAQHLVAVAFEVRRQTVIEQSYLSNTQSSYIQMVELRLYQRYLYLMINFTHEEFK